MDDEVKYYFQIHIILAIILYLLRDILVNLLRNIIIMDTKLTLNIDKELVKRMKAYAKKNKVSLSHLVRNYFSSILSDGDNDLQPTPLVKSLTGILPKDLDEKEYYDYLDKKYNK